MFEERIVNKPVELSDKIIETFENKNQTFYSQYHHFLVDMREVLNFVSQTEKSWNYILTMRSKAVTYLDNVTMTKAEVAAGLTSKAMEENVRQLVLYNRYVFKIGKRQLTFSKRLGRQFISLKKFI